jgi:DNA uptake protein ComE-like DNA-binding protein
MLGIKGDYFIFSKKEKRGVWVLGILLTISFMWSGLLSYRNNTIPKQKKQWSRRQYESLSNHSYDSKETNSLPATFFVFDPNTIDSQQALLLGMSSRQAKTLLKYRSRGGRFYKKEDIFKLYGLDSLLANALVPYIQIHSTTRKEKVWTINLNEASVLEWKQKTALTYLQIQSIQQYQKSHGLFYSIYELPKVYGITDSLFQVLKPHLRVDKNVKNSLNSRTMNFNQWKSLDLFSDQQIFQILALRKKQGGEMGWRNLVIMFDLTQDQATILTSKIIIND